MPVTLQQFNYFAQYVLPSLDGHWMKDSIAITYLEGNFPTPQKALLPKNCGPAALSALFGLGVLQYLPGHALEMWKGLNRRDMEKALLELDLPFDRLHSSWPVFGLCLIQWQGPWLERCFNGSSLAYTHWVAVVENYVFDTNWGEWLPKNVWEECVVYNLLAAHKGNEGWKPLTAYEFHRRSDYATNSSCSSRR